MRTIFACCPALALAAALTGAAAAQDAPQDAVPVEVTETETTTVTLHLHEFLTPEEVQTLRTVATTPAALALFVPQGQGFAALAVAPQEGFIRDSMPVASAVAVAELPDAATAQAQAVSQCDAARTKRRPCVVILEVAPRVPVPGTP